jgi:hypothetical protein
MCSIFFCLCLDVSQGFLYTMWRINFDVHVIGLPGSVALEFIVSSINYVVCPL